MKLKSFGCSFVWGSELLDTDLNGPCSVASQHTWPALVAQRLGLDYECRARPGSGNFQIANHVMNHAALHDDDTMFVIGWTWIDRFDYIVDEPDWRPTWETICPISDSAAARNFYRHVHSEPWDKLRNLTAMIAVLHYLKQLRIPFVMTLMDELVMDRRWHVSPAIGMMQAELGPCISRFDGVDFLTWSKQQGYAITEIGHPREEAHAAAAELMLPVISDAIRHRA